MPVYLCIPLPFRSVRWYAYHACLCHSLAFCAFLHVCLHVHAWVLLASVSSMLQYNGAMDIRSKPTFIPHGHDLLFISLPVSLFACLLALMLYLPCLSTLSALCLFIMLFASFPSMACLLVSCLCLYMYTHGVRAWSPRHKQKGWGCEHEDMSQAVAISRFRSLTFPSIMYTFKPPPSSSISPLDGLY